MDYPYCIVDGVEMQLLFDKHGTLRFPNTKEDCPDLNKLVMDYYNGNTELNTVWDEYTKTGSSYSMVTGLFTTHGINNHTVNQGNGTYKDMTLCTGDIDIDASYNLNDEDKAYYKLEETFEKILDGWNDLGPKQIETLLTGCISQVNKVK